MSTLTLEPARQFATVHELRPAPPAARAAAPRTAPQGSVRLTRRGRVVVFSFALFVVLAVGIFMGAGSVATGESGTPAPSEIVMVGEGETLWGIAAEIAEDGEVRSVMREIERMNALESPVLEAGQKLRVPLAE